MSEPNPVPMLMTERASTPADGTVLETPGKRPNVVVTVMSPLAQALVRGLRTYIQAVLGLLVVALAGPVTGVLAPTAPGDFLAALKLAGGLALAPTVVSLLQNFGEILLKFDEMFPRTRA